MATVNVHEAKTHLSRLLERAERGERIVIARAGRPVAVLQAIEPIARRQPGSDPIVIHDDFDDPIPDFDLDRLKALDSGRPAGARKRGRRKGREAAR
jgi:prevent-host-death family protein